MLNSKELAKQTTELFKRSASLNNSFHLQPGKSNNDLDWITNENSNEVHYTSEPKASLIRKLGVYIMGLLPIESLL